MLTVVRQVVYSVKEGGGCVILTVVRQVVCSDKEGGRCDFDWLNLLKANI